MRGLHATVYDVAAAVVVVGLVVVGVGIVGVAVIVVVGIKAVAPSIAVVTEVVIVTSPNDGAGAKAMFSAGLQIADIRRRASSGQPQIKLDDNRDAGMRHARCHRLGRSLSGGDQRTGR